MTLDASNLFDQVCGLHFLCFNSRDTHLPGVGDNITLRTGHGHSISGINKHITYTYTTEAGCVKSRSQYCPNITK